MQTTAAKEIVIFMIGGTIAMKSSPLGAVPSDDLEESLRAALKTTPQSAVSIRLVPWSSKPSPHVTADDMFALAQDMEKELAKKTVHGAIVLHGTDLLAETAFVLDRALVSPKPVVCSGSMRHMEENGYDGIRNVVNSVVACLAMPDFSEVLVQMADCLYIASDTLKFDSLSVASMRGMVRGVVGRVVDNKAFFTQEISVKRPRLPFSVTGIKSRVPLISCYPGMTTEDIVWPCLPFVSSGGARDDSKTAARTGGTEGTEGAGGAGGTGPKLASCGEKGRTKENFKTTSPKDTGAEETGAEDTDAQSKNVKVKDAYAPSPILETLRSCVSPADFLPDGVVLEGFGAGNVPPGILDFVGFLLSQDVPVVLASRSPLGGVMPLYGYTGGGGELLHKGVLSAKTLSAIKAQLLLKMALASGCSKSLLKDVFNEL